VQYTDTVGAVPADPSRLTAVLVHGLEGRSLCSQKNGSDRHEKEMQLEVNCYSGRKADERPVRFRLDERDYTVEEVLEQWYGPDAAFYKVRAQDGRVYVLRQQAPDGSWHLVPFRQST
jgi:hypothetical protein